MEKPFLTYSKKNDNADVMIFKRFYLQRKKSELCNICEQEMLDSNFFNKNKNFRNAIFEYLCRAWFFIFTA